MAHRDIDDTRFTDEEVEEILSRAVTRESSALTARHGGVSLDDLRSIGKEVGIEGADLEKAARAVLGERQRSSGGWLGGPRSLHVERTVDGTPAPGTLPDLVSTIRRTVGRKGSASDLQGSLEWTSSSETVEAYATVATTDDRTTIRAGADLSNLAAITFLPTGLVGIISSFIAFTQAAEAANEVGMVLCALAIPALYLVLRTIYGRLAASEEAKLEATVDELARAVMEGEGA